MSNHSPKLAYQQLLAQGDIAEDLGQQAVIAHLDKIYYDLLHEHQRRFGVLNFLRKPKLVQGLYLWGDVGIGKTFMMDLFFTCLPFTEKKRLHFHHFMQTIHQALRDNQGHPEPLTLVAKNIAKETLVLCFDEFTVADITDAMLLSGLFQALFAHGVCLVATSNVEPDNLYLHGLQRERFIPTIDLLKTHTEVVHFLGEHDYRLRHLEEVGAYFTPLDAESAHNMQLSFDLFTRNQTINYTDIIIYDRNIKTIKHTDDVIWFDFQAICGIPRCQKDYLALSEIYHTVLVSNVPVIQERQYDLIINFIHLVDVLYDAKVRLIISAEEAASSLYTTGRMHMQFARTQSRLIEMRSADYFANELKEE